MLRGLARNWMKRGKAGFWMLPRAFAFRPRRNNSAPAPGTPAGSSRCGKACFARSATNTTSGPCKISPNRVCAGGEARTRRSGSKPGCSASAACCRWNCRGRHERRRLFASHLGLLVARARRIQRLPVAARDLEISRSAPGQSSATPAGAGGALAGGRQVDAKTRRLVHRSKSPTISWPVLCAKILEVQHDEFWSWHWTFRSARLKKPQPLLGDARVTDLAVNVVLPWLWTRAAEGRNEIIRRTIEHRRAVWPAAEDNSILKLARQRLLGVGRSCWVARRFNPTGFAPDHA